MDSEQESFKILMFPFVAHGHISPFIELAKKLADNGNFYVYLCSTPVNLSSVKNKVPEKYSFSIELVEFHLPILPELPPHFHTTNGLPLHLNSTLCKALTMSKPKFSNLLKSLQPDLLIHDILQPWAGSVSALLNIPSVSFLTSGAVTESYFCHLSMRPGNEFPFPAISLTDFEPSLAVKNYESAKNDVKDSDGDDHQPTDRRIMLVNSSREMDGKYMDYLSELMNWDIISFGSLVQDPSIGDENSEVMKWLEEKNEGSTVFVSFGSEYFLKKEDIEEIAYGLEVSNVNFIWVVRFPKGDEMKIEEALPKGYLERVGGRGKIVEKWAPQAKILKHSSIGGFVCHCGWNSIMESIDFGVPIIAMPMHLDQPLNARLVVELGVGVEVLRDENGRFNREEISRTIEDVVFGKGGSDLRTRIQEKRESIRNKTKEEIDGVVKKIAQLCGNSIKEYSKGRQRGK